MASSRGILCAAAGLLVAGAIGSAGCESEPAALEVGSITYTESELGALTTTQRHRLGLLTALGLAIAESDPAETIRPFVEYAQDSIVFERLLLERAAALRGLGEADLHAFYVADPDYRLTVRHIVILAERWRDAATRSEAAARARQALDRVGRGEDFAAVAAELSEEPGADRRGGLLDPARRGDWVPEFWSAAAALEPGAVSDVVETRYGYHVLQLVARDRIPFDSVRWDAMGRSRLVVSGVPAARAALERELAPDSIDRASLAIAARSRGITTSAIEDARLEREWSARLAGLAATLGFAHGSSAEDVKEGALRALADPRQSVRIAVAELAGLAGPLERIHPIRTVEPARN